ncbi:MAG: nucleoside monophosphate kinase [Parcubacteria group bacterium]
MKHFNKIKNIPVIIFLGKPGSGKGTQAELLGERLKLDYVGSGDLLRERKTKNDFTGKKIKKIVDAGGLVSTPIIFKLWLDKFEDFKNKENFRGFIMDGSPRKIFEAHLIDEVLKWYDWDKNVKIMLIDISNKEVIWRLTKRRICKKCEKIIPYVGEWVKVKKCPKCGGELMHRADDTTSGVKNRLEWFKSEVHPVINFYRKTGRLIKIKGEQSIENVFKEILKALQ